MATFSKEKGLLEAGKDDGVIRGVSDMWLYMYMSGFFPLVHTTILRISGLLGVHWGMFWRKAFAALSLNQTAKPKTKNPFAVSKHLLLASKEIEGYIY